MSRIDQIINDIIKKEGSVYTNHPSDRGGPTKYGITLETLTRHRKTIVSARDVELLTEAEAKTIYVQKYVNSPGFNLLVPLNEAVAAEVVDAGVLSGPARAATWLQTALNALNRQEQLYADIPEDGDAGATTRAALAAYLAKRGVAEGQLVLLRALNALQGAFFIDISRTRKANEDFVYGWFAHRVSI